MIGGIRNLERTSPIAGCVLCDIIIHNPYSNEATLMRTFQRTQHWILILTLVAVLWVGSRTAAAKAPQDSPYYVYLPLVNEPCTVYLPIVSVAEPLVEVGPYGGSVVALVADPVNPNVMYAGSWGAGVFRSTDGGNVWVAYNQGLKNLNIDSLAIDPVRPNVLYAGTHAGGVYKSVDSGASWSAANTGIQADAIVYSLAVNPANPNLVLAGTRDYKIPTPPWHGVMYRSFDGGANWSPVLQNVGGSGAQDWIYSIAMDPNAPATMFAASHEHGPFRSDDNGATWTPIGAGSVDGSGRGVAVDPRPARQGTLYYGVWHRLGVYKSTNRGNTWALASDGLGDAKIYPNGIAIAYTHPDTLYLADFTGKGVLKSSNAAGSWGSAGLQNINIYSVLAGRQDPNLVFAGTQSHGLYRSGDGGNTWSDGQFGIRNTAVSGMVFAADAALYAAASGQGVYRSIDMGTTWTGVNVGLENLDVNSLAADPSNRDVLYAATEGGLFKMDIHGGGWARVSNGLPAGMVASQSAPSETSFGADHPFDRHEPGDELMQADAQVSSASAASRGAVLSLVFAASNPRVAYAAVDGAGVYASSDGGASWVPAGLAGSAPWSLSVDADDPATVYAALKGSPRVMVSTDGGQNWSDLGQPGPQVEVVYAVAQPGAEPGTVYAGSDDGLWKHAAAGWVRAGLDGRAVPLLVPDPASAGRLFAGTTAGAYYSADGGATWVSATGALQDATIRSVSFDPDDPRHVYIGTTLRGALRVPIQ